MLNKNQVSNSDNDYAEGGNITIYGLENEDKAGEVLDEAGVVLDEAGVVLRICM